ncbi:unnamed protein product [Vitrella brassicaformis CCMP3155]|uniref:Uncharacterized protein n=2 Tax=Vitrella brassicaformis TaxID=1169539 RepID=A0A0G4GMT7_VITBC|nr:unnamed protein product [Vitrella brassicaformis CCMP3155]|mmetsp:Transcript_16262/g.38908  ORF Transcript_16262/g.38908 Transcript_16262/m.38908 type:complete len:301 (+) Transcript_16262:151-1053(+)|eukprot:CEM31520.1 unnamed protein product [Vitrella brassicaformis CCMP3155]
MMSLLLPAASLVALLAVPSGAAALNHTAGVSPHRSLAATLPSGHGGLELSAESPCVFPNETLSQWQEIMDKDARSIMAEKGENIPETLTFLWLDPGKTMAGAKLKDIITNFPEGRTPAGREAFCGIDYWFQLIPRVSHVGRPSLPEYGYCGREGKRVCACVSMPGYGHFKQCRPLEGEPTVEQDNEVTQLGTELASLLPTAGSNKKSWGKKCIKDHDCYTPPLVAKYQKPKCFKKEKAKHGPNVQPDTLARVHTCVGVQLEAELDEVCDKAHQCRDPFLCSSLLSYATSFFKGTCEKSTI